MLTEIKLYPYIDFGSMPIANAFLTPDQFGQEFFYHMLLGYDPATKAIGLINKVPPEKMFHDNYAFFSSTSRGMQSHFRQTAEKLLLYAKNGIVVEIGSNDGIMLEAWKELNVPAIGIEPSGNVAGVSKASGHQVIVDFVSDKAVEQILSQGNVSLVFGANVSCHVEDFENYLRCITKLISENGVFVFEDPYFLDICEKTSYDQIYDEHVWYFTVTFINNMLDPLGYHVFDCEHIDVHGGELRMYVGKKEKFPISASVPLWLAKETDLEKKIYELNLNIKRSKLALVDLLNDLKKSGKKVCGFGATSKGVIITNYCDIGPDLIPFITDNTPVKQGKFYPGTHIPIVPQGWFNGDIEVAVLFAWNHFKEIDQSQSWFKGNGGRWLTHVPWPRLI